MGAAENIEDGIRTTMQTKRIRVTEFFKDFDRLRSGFITESQFQRGLDQFLGLRLTTEEVKNLIDKYSLRQDGMVNYRYFSEVIDRNFVANELSVSPEAQVNQPLEYLGTERSHIQFGTETLAKIDSILRKMENYYSYHGVNVRTSFEDFDKHHNGLITLTQFERNFPGPADVQEEDIKLLAQFYKDPIKLKLTNYLNFHNDIEKLKKAAIASKILLAPQPPEVDPSQLLDALVPDDPAIKAILDKMRVAVHKNGIRIEEFFKDHDKLRSGVITKNQFLCGMKLGIQTEAHLTNYEMDKLANYYLTSDERVQYTPVCAIMKHAFNVPNLDKQPTVHPIVPPKGALTRSLISLSNEEEEVLVKTLAYLRKEITKRRLLMYPVFKDFDRGVAYTRNVTKLQFGRVLHVLGLTVDKEELLLLLRKFELPESGDINYPAFCQAVDQEFHHYTIDAPEPVPSTTYVPPLPPPSIDTSHVNFTAMMGRIRHFVLVNRLRVIEFFEDFDSLRSGSVTRAIFARCLDVMGVTWLDKAHLHALMNTYMNHNKPDLVEWKRFMEDVESVFTLPDLEKQPNRKVPSMESFLLPKEGFLEEWVNAPKEVKDTLEVAMARMRSRIFQRRMFGGTKPVFQDFDRHNNGHITKSQYRQCMVTLELYADDVETAAIEARYSDNIGFDYVKFLDDLIPHYKELPKYSQHLEDLKLANANKKPPEIDNTSDFNLLMTKVKSIVAKQRMRLYEFLKDFDKLRSGRVSYVNFARALDLAHLDLKESEVKMLTQAFRSITNPGFVNYLTFCDEVETIFTLKHLEKNPLVTPTQFKPPVEWEQNALTKEQLAMFNEAMMVLAEHVRKTRIQLFPLFEDFDRVNNGWVTKGQFRRVLKELEMEGLIHDEEIRVICQQYRVHIGGRDDVNYIPFCEHVYELGKFVSRHP